MLKEPAAVDSKGEEQTGSGLQLWALKKGYKSACVDILHLDDCSKVKYTKLKTALIGNKILEKTVIFL